jgi:hypothetical protein
MGNPITEVQGAVFNPDILHRAVLKYRLPKLVARNVFDTRFEDVKVGDNIDVARVSRIQVGTITLGSGFKTTTYQAPTETKATIAINKWVYGAVALEAYEMAVAAKDLDALYRQSSIDTVLVKIDADALAEADNFSQTVGTDNVNLTDDNVLTAIQALDAANVPPEDRHVVMHTTQMIEFFKLDKYVNWLYRGGTPVNKLRLGEMYGAEWWKTTQVKAGAQGHVNFACHKAVVVRKSPQAWMLDDPDTQARKIVYPAIYGFGELRDDHGHELLGL